MDWLTITYVLRIVAAGLAVILAVLLLHDAISEETVNRGRVAGLAFGLILSASAATFLLLNSPD